MDAQAQPLVSVVTPVHNTDEYLEECIKSVLRQSYSNFEYIICENYSTDRSGEIARDYALQDKRIRIVQPDKLLPQSQNFNFALQCIAPESQYTKVLLADDWIFPHCLEEMVVLAEAHPKVGLVSSFRMIEEAGAGFGIPAGTSVLGGREACRLHLLGRVYPFGNPSAVLYRSSIVRERAPHFYPEDRLYPDTDAAFQILMHHDFAFVHQVLTFAREHQPGSISSEIRHYQPFVVHLLIFLHDYGPKCMSAEEFERRFRQVRSEFYEGLGTEWLKDRVRRPRKRFWEYQQRGLAEIGGKIESSRLGLGVSVAMLKAVGSPLSMAKQALRYLHKTTGYEFGLSKDWDDDKYGKS